MADELRIAPDDLRHTMALSPELAEAAFRRRAGSIGAIVHDARAFHHGSVRTTLRSGVSADALHTAFASAVTWAAGCSAVIEAVDAAGAA